MGSLFANFENTIDALMSYMLDDDLDKNKYKILVDKSIKQFKNLERFLNNTYNSYLNNINFYKNILIEKVYNEPLTITYLNEEYCKGVPNCLPSSIKFTGEEANELSKGFFILANSKLGYLVDEKGLMNISQINSKYLKAYRSYLYNPKKKIYYIQEDMFKKNMNIIFKKSTKQYSLTNRDDVMNMIPSKYLTQEYITIKNLLSNIISTLAILKVKQSIPIRINNNVKYVTDNFFRITKTYMTMYKDAFLLYDSKMKTRIELLKKAV